MFDLLIRGGKIIDGSGNPWFYGDLAVEGEVVAEVLPPGQIDPGRARDVVDATAMVVCPGFIDIQSHSIVPLMVDGRCLSKITQGVTTEIMGEAWTPAPFGGRVSEYNTFNSRAERLKEWSDKAKGWTRFGDRFDALTDRGVSPNVGSFLGRGTLRSYAKGMDMGSASAEERDLMRRIMRESMEDGAFGVSYALIYPPDTYVDTDEIVEICRVVSEYGGIYITHLRNEAQTLLEALGEAVEIAHRAGLPVEVYHLKAAGKSNWSKIPQAIAAIDEARATGIDVTADMYPYAASGTGLTSVLPPWSSAEGKLYQNLRDPEMRERIRQAMLNPNPGWEATGRDGAETIMPIGFDREENKQYSGRRLSEIAAMRGEHWVDSVFNLLADEGHSISTIFFSMDESNLSLQMRQSWMKISSDAGGMDPTWAAPVGPVHPRSYGTYPRVLGRFVREQGVITLEDAIRRMTSSVADRLGLHHRGALRPGYHADVVIFDPTTVIDRSTFSDPHQLSDGIRDVWVNGRRVLRDGEHTGALPGHTVRGIGYRPR